jgi:hypothetical protein
VALAQRPDGVGTGAAALARTTQGAPTSVQNSLRSLAAHGLVRRGPGGYALAADQPAAEELIALGLRLAPPRAAIGLLIRANDSVEFACVDETGFIVGMQPNPAPDALARFETSIETIHRGRSDVPVVLRFDTDELARILRSALGLRTRVASAEIVKGGVRGVGPLATGSGR